MILDTRQCGEDMPGGGARTDLVVRLGAARRFGRRSCQVVSASNGWVEQAMLRVKYVVLPSVHKLAFCDKGRGMVAAARASCLLMAAFSGLQGCTARDVSTQTHRADGDA